jgi:hypothetical protein
MFLSMALSVVLAQTVVLDRIAATIDREVITVSAVDQAVMIRLIPRNAGEDETAYRRRVLDALVAQALRYRDVQRFGAEDVPPDFIEARLRDLEARFASPEEFATALVLAELTLEDVRALIKRQLQVESHVQERFSPIIFVSPEEIDTHYRTRWLPQRAERGLSAQPLDEVREEIRQLLRAERLQAQIDVWTQQLRERANVDVFVYR